jgi:NADH kinase
MIASPNSELLALKWSAPPQNILLVKKESAPLATEAMKEFAKYVCEEPFSISEQPADD